MSVKAQGWYRDPFKLHEDRYFSEGWPTKLVRDDGKEAYDLPPDLPLPEDGVTPAPDNEYAFNVLNGSDLRRADRYAADIGRRGSETAARAVFDMFDQAPPGW